MNTSSLSEASEPSNPEMETLEFWDSVGSSKTFEDPFEAETFLKDLPRDACLVEYGCGYGRIPAQIDSLGFQNVRGYDFSPRMIQKGRRLFPHLHLDVVKAPFQIPLENESVDGLVLSTVLTCIPKTEDLLTLRKEIFRVLKPEGRLYISDFFITENDRYLPLYQQYEEKVENYGTFITPEGAYVRHFERDWFFSYVQEFSPYFYEEKTFHSMNGHPINSFCWIGKKPKAGQSRNVSDAKTSEGN